MTPSHWLGRSPLLGIYWQENLRLALGKPDERVSRVGQFDASVDETLFISELQGG
jgi:hypothetical protein